jgi:hypothetical protein
MWRTAPAREVLRVWLERTYFTTFGHGSDLVMNIADVWPADASWLADKWLRALLEAGWLKKNEKPTPSPQQAFAGVGGMCGRAIMKSPEWAPLCVFGYSPTTTGLESPIWKWLISTKDEAR